MRKIEKQARLDAHEFARAKMSFGEGAGIRRRLIETQVMSRSYEDPKYARAFQRALANEDMVKHAKAAKKERRMKDTGNFISRNGRAVLRGDRKNADAIVIAAVIGGYYAHQMGWDRKAWDMSKRKYEQVKAWAKKQPMVYNITNVQQDIKTSTDQQS